MDICSFAKYLFHLYKRKFYQHFQDDKLQNKLNTSQNGKRGVLHAMHFRREIALLLKAPDHFARELKTNCFYLNDFDTWRVLAILMLFNFLHYEIYR